MTFELTPQQQLIKDAVLSGDHRAIAIEANPGSAKTTTCVAIIQSLPNKPKGYMTCFGADMKKELEGKLKDTNFTAKTFNSFGWLATKLYLEKELGRTLSYEDMSCDNAKYRKLASDAIEGKYSGRYNIPALLIPDATKYDGLKFMDNMVNFSMSTLTEPTDIQGMVRIMTAYQFEPSIDPELCNEDEAYAIQEEIKDWGLDNLSEFVRLGADQIKENISMTFTDQIYYTVKWNLNCFPREFLVIDEAQDMSKLDLALLKKCVRKNGMVVLVGDPNQGIMRFRGAMPGSFEKMIEAFNAKRYQLSSTFRCPRRIVRLAQMVSPNLEAFFDRDGSISMEQPAALLEVVKEHEGEDIAILARTSAPLIAMCLALITNDIPCTIVGTDIGESLNRSLDIVAKMDGYTFSNLSDYLVRYKVNTVTRMEKEHADERDIRDFTTTTDALGALIKRHASAYSLDDLKYRIAELFRANPDGNGIKIMTAHKSKGLEFETVILHNDFDIKREGNLVTSNPIDESFVWFVAVTRAKTNLIVLSEARPDWLIGHLPGDATYALPPFAPSQDPIEPAKELPTEPEAEEPKLADIDEQEDKPVRVLTNAGKLAQAWAQELLKEDFYILDVESTCLRGEIVQLAVCDKHGNVLINTLVKPLKFPISDYTQKEIGITPEMVKDAPTFDMVYHTLVDVVSDKIVIAYNSDFDKERVRVSAECAKMPELNHLVKWNCAMKRYASYNPDKVNKGYSGSWWKLEEAIQQEGITIPDGKFHDAKTDIRATLAVIQSMAGVDITAFSGKDEPLPLKETQWGTFNYDQLVHIIANNRQGYVRGHLPPNQYSVQLVSQEIDDAQRVRTYQESQLLPIQYLEPLEAVPVDEVKPIYQYDAPIGHEPQIMVVKEETPKPVEPTIGDRVYVRPAKENATVRAVSTKLISVKLDSGTHMAYSPKDLSAPVEKPKPRKPRVSHKVRTQVKQMLNAPNVELDHLYEIRDLIADAIKDAEAKTAVQS